MIPTTTITIRLFFPPLFFSFFFNRFTAQPRPRQLQITLSLPLPLRARSRSICRLSFECASSFRIISLEISAREGACARAHERTGGTKLKSPSLSNALFPLLFFFFLNLFFSFIPFFVHRLPLNRLVLVRLIFLLLFFLLSFFLTFSQPETFRFYNWITSYFLL